MTDSEASHCAAWASYDFFTGATVTFLHAVGIDFMGGCWSSKVGTHGFHIQRAGISRRRTFQYARFLISFQQRLYEPQYSPCTLADICSRDDLPPSSC
ncbi:hypothetical protein ABKN59_005711 [Abortiporus biennis]